MMTKKNVLIVSVAYVAYVGSLLLISGICHATWCRVSESDVFGLIMFSFAPLLPVFILSLITYRLKDEVFQAWWNFARWWVIVIIAVTFLLENASGGGTLGMNQDFTAFILIILYSIFMVTSLVKIVREYVRVKDAK